MKVAGLQALFQKLPSWKGITWIFYVLAHREEFKTLVEARRRERQIKSWKSHRSIQALIEHGQSG